MNKVLHKCGVSVIAKNKNLNHCELIGEHTHKVDEKVLAKTKFDLKLDDAIINNKYLGAREIYNKAKENLRFDEIMKIPDRTSYASYVCRRKHEFIPNIPYTITEFEEFIGSEQYKEIYGCDKQNKTFYRGVWTTKKGHWMIVFVSETALEILKKMKLIEILMDGTFKILPRHIKFSQLYIINFMFEERCYPLAYVFMEKRDISSYDLLFAKLTTLITPEVAAKIFRCMTDYEAAVRNSMRKHFPNARISGCFFHYVKAIYKSARKFGLAKDATFESAIQEISALALLPNNFISKAFNIISSRYQNSERWKRFEAYFKRQWVGANISVYGLINRSNNFSETLNKSANLLSGRPHHNIWVVINNIKEIEMDKSIQLTKHYGGKMYTKKTNKHSTDLSSFFLKLMTDFEKDQGVAKFLRNASFEFNFEDVFKVDHDFGDNDYNDFNDDEELFPANDFDVNHNFNRNDKNPANTNADFLKRNVQADADLLNRKQSLKQPKIKSTEVQNMKNKRILLRPTTEGKKKKIKNLKSRLILLKLKL